MIKHIYLFIFAALSFQSFAQYPPAVGQIGSTAIYKDSSIFIDWAITCDIKRGYVDISDTTIEDPAYPGTNKASYGDNTAAFGKADNNTISLGDGGSAVLTFSHPISNGQGFDFAVFENSFDDIFLELAYVEVSSDGIHFVRFPSVSLSQTTTQIQGFGTLDATKIYNLAGKYKVYYGTPFDLSDLQDSTGIDISHIIAVKIVDVVGSISELYKNYDSQGHIINDPFPTPFGTGGFDLDAVGVINNSTNTGVTSIINATESIKIYPNPVADFLYIAINNRNSYNIQLINASGKIVKQINSDKNININVMDVSSGIYLVKVSDNNGNVFTQKIIINKL